MHLQAFPFGIMTLSVRNANLWDARSQEIRCYADRFALVVEEAIRKRESQLGFELDEDDVKSLVGILRIKYCGPQGMIGPC